MKITLAGVPGSGKSMLRRRLAKHYHLTIKGTGDFMRSIALQYGYDDITKFLMEYVSKHPEMDHQIDDAQRRFGEENQNFVLDAHLGFLFVPDSIKIFLKCDPKIAAQRILSAKRITEAAQNLQSVMKANQQRIWTMKTNFKKLYGVEFHHESNFDFVLDTSNLSPSEVSKKVVDYIQSILQTPTLDSPNGKNNT